MGVDLSGGNWLVIPLGVGDWHRHRQRVGLRLGEFRSLGAVTIMRPASWK